MQYFTARTHMGHHAEFLGHSWEDGGFATGPDGAPRCDARGNTVASYSTRPVSIGDAALLALTYAGGEAVTDLAGFLDFCAAECGLSDADVAIICADLDLEPTTR